MDTFRSTQFKPSSKTQLLKLQIGKAQRFSIVDNSGIMGTQFYQLELDAFNSIVPGKLPSHEDREKFMVPGLESDKMSAYDIGVELVCFSLVCLLNHLMPTTH